MIEGIISFMVALGLAEPVGQALLPMPGLAAFLGGVIVLAHILHRRIAKLVIDLATVGQTSRRQWWRLCMPPLHWFAFWLVQHAGWGALVGEWGTTWPAPLATVVVLLPWVALHVSWLAARCRIEVALRRKPWPVLSYIAFHMRIWVIPLTPVALTELTVWLGRSMPSFGLAVDSYPSLVVLGSVCLIGLLFSAAPFLARLAVPTDSLPPGDLRTALEGVARGAGFKCLDIRVCRTHDHVANAAFLGVLGRLRYVVITDGLLKKLGLEEMAGVFAHEVGHSMKRHVQLNLCMITSFTVLAAVFEQSGLSASPLGAWPLILAFPAFLLFIYAPIARRFESEADLFAATTLGSPGPIVRSLSALGRLYPHRRAHGGLVHPGLDERVAFIEKASSVPEVRGVFEAGMSRLKRRILMISLLPLLLLAAGLPDELAAGSLRFGVLQASRTEDEGLALEMVKRLDRWEERGGKDPGYELGMWCWQTIVLARQERGGFDEAGEALRVVQQHRSELSNPVLLYNAAIISAQQAAATGAWEALDREVSKARQALEVLVPIYGADDVQMHRETRDVAFLVAGRNLLRRWGVLVGDQDPPDVELKGAHYEAIEALGTDEMPASEPRLGRPWKQAFWERLKTLQHGGN